MVKGVEKLCFATISKDAISVRWQFYYIMTYFVFNIRMKMARLNWAKEDFLMGKVPNNLSFVSIVFLARRNESNSLKGFIILREYLTDCTLIFGNHLIEALDICWLSLMNFPWVWAVFLKKKKDDIFATFKEWRSWLRSKDEGK